MIILTDFVCIIYILRATQYRTAGQKYRNHQLGQLYDIDQLTAMKWARNAWAAISHETIQNCWVKTGLLNFETEQERALKEAAAEADRRLSDELDILLADVHHDSAGIESIDLIPDEESKDIHAPILVDELINDAVIDVDIGMYYIYVFKLYKYLYNK